MKEESQTTVLLQLEQHKAVVRVIAFLWTFLFML